MSELALRHVYRWNGALLDLAARARSPEEPSAPEPAEEADLTAQTERLFLSIAGWSGNPEHVAAIGCLNQRLRRVRRTEEELLPDIAVELADIATLMSGGPSPALRRRLVAYHRRRERAVDLTVAALLKLRPCPR